MFRAINEPSHSGAGSLSGVRVCGFIVGCGAVLAAICCVLFGVITFLDITQHYSVGALRLFVIFFCSFALSYGLFRIRAGLLDGHRFAQLGGMAWGVLLLLFCCPLLRDARGPINPEAPDAQELDGPLFFISALAGLWLIGYLSLKRVSLIFLGTGPEE